MSPSRLRGRGAIALFGLLIAPPPAIAADSGQDVAARLGGADISGSTLREFVRTLDPALRKQALSDPAVMTRLVRQELMRLAILNEANQKKWQQRPEIVARLARSRDDLIASTYLAAMGAVPADYPSDAEIQAAYDANLDKFMLPRQYRLEQIFIAVPAGADTKTEASARTRAEALAATARGKDADFDTIAKANSDKTPGEPAGDLGWATEAQIVQEIRSQVSGLSVGEVGDPIRTPTGFHVIRLADTKPAGARPLAEVRDQIISALRQAKLQENEQAYVSSLLQRTPAMINEPTLRKIFESP